MSTINWNNGRLIELGEGDTATSNGSLNNGQLYCLFFYNAAGNDASTTLQVVWSNSQPPVSVTVPGTTMNQGLAALCFIDGSQTNTVSIAITNGNQGAKIQAFIGSVKMPIDTNGINNKKLPLNGENQSFEKFTRFYAVPESHWYSGQIQSNINQFTAVQFAERSAEVIIVNKLVNPDTVIKYAGDAKDFVTITTSDTQTSPFNLQGNGQQLVWINADSTQNSNQAYISVQSLSELYLENNTTELEALSSLA
ncbi:hypothetical protein D1816_11240 [Aquimarina sp. AD10]|uniref:Uncharacterized protein n=1 Tax=Aquimarina aggregata TaxID=1642818 RepID=A0A162Y9I7_9FLAO|nr:MULTISPECIES: hypothetical protein [Aquimarina]AXT60896.1 hypothetical protein D1816_11240 [Aquimarina sp. AD10]KZS39006.1 hypothetical protein AWE51_10590 [Aquimarina aggregata]RKM93027.1 hypothetical protein D7033_20205 [Aquimarina sp. AD10]